MKKPFYVQKIKVVAVKEEKDFKNTYLQSPQAVYDLLFIQDELLHCDREKFICLHLNTKNSLLSYEVVSVGSLNASLVHPRELFKGAILVNAASIILCHNHPSDDPEPSPDDVSLTKRLVESGNILGIPVVDHVIFSDKEFVSLKERGIL
jgi:DNA repair protein RadC